MAAPALAASSAEVAICSGVTGTAGLRPGVSAEPVTAHEMMTLRCMTSPKMPGELASPCGPQRRCPRFIAGPRTNVAWEAKTETTTSEGARSSGVASLTVAVAAAEVYAYPIRYRLRH